MKKLLLVLLLGSLSLTLVLAHPHIGKKVSVKIGGTDVSVQYSTSPANMSRLEGVAVGDFVTTGARLTLGGELNAGGATLAAGDYVVGTVRKGKSNWTMVLYPGSLGRGESPDKSKLVELGSAFSGDMAHVDHISLDLAPGSGSMAGKVVLVWRFGPLHLTGALS